MNDVNPITVFCLYSFDAPQKPTVMRGQEMPSVRYDSILEELLKRDKLKKLTLEQTIEKLQKKGFYEVVKFEVWQLPLVTAYVEIGFCEREISIRQLGYRVYADRRAKGVSLRKS